MRHFLIAGLIAGAFATPAFAQVAPPPPGPQAGFHVEGLLGYDSARIYQDSDGGLLYGIGAGYDFRAGRILLGITAEAVESTNHGCIQGLAVPGDSLCSRAGRDLYIGGRAGANVARNVLLYATAGYTNARFRVDYDDGTPGGTSTFGYSQNLDGARVGLGAELGIGRNAFIRTEARYSNYEGGSDRGQVVGGFGFRF
jgi:outer membrane immunogenic protein